jgi:phosphinothricin acetyltransferase
VPWGGGFVYAGDRDNRFQLAPFWGYLLCMIVVGAAPKIDTMRTEDWPAVGNIYLEGILGGHATFEESVPSWEEWDTGHLKVCRLVARNDDGAVVGWAALRPVSPRACYRGVAEVSVYVAKRCQRQGIGRQLLREMIRASEEAGIWTLQGSIFPENHLSLKMCEVCGFRQVGRRKHVAKMDGLWRDTVMVERRSTRVGIS